MTRSLSRVQTKKYQKKQVLLPNTLFLNILDMELQDQILNADKYDFDILKAMDVLKNDGMNVGNRNTTS